MSDIFIWFRPRPCDNGNVIRDEVFNKLNRTVRPMKRYKAVFFRCAGKFLKGYRFIIVVSLRILIWSELSSQFLLTFVYSIKRKSHGKGRRTAIIERLEHMVITNDDFLFRRRCERDRFYERRRWLRLGQRSFIDGYLFGLAYIHAPKKDKTGNKNTKSKRFPHPCILQEN